MYPYRMQQLIHARGNEDIVNVRHRASLYQAISRLQRDGLVEVHGTAQTENRPERTVYRLTDAGRDTIHAWLRQMLAEPATEFPEFPAALSFVYLLEPEVVRLELARRVDTLESKRKQLAEVLDEHASAVPRLFMIETEYQRTVIAAELDWLRTVMADLDAGLLTWNPAAIRDAHPPEGDDREA